GCHHRGSSDAPSIVAPALRHSFRPVAQPSQKFPGLRLRALPLGPPPPHAHTPWPRPADAAPRGPLPASSLCPSLVSRNGPLLEKIRNYFRKSSTRDDVASHPLPSSPLVRTSFTWTPCWHTPLKTFLPRPLLAYNLPVLRLAILALEPACVQPIPRRVC